MEEGGRKQNRSLTHDVDMEGIANKMRENKSKRSSKGKSHEDDDVAASAGEKKGCCVLM